MVPSGVHAISPSVPPGRHTRTSSSAVCWWSGANIAPMLDTTTSNSPFAHGRASASASAHSSSAPAASASRRPASSSSGVRSDATTEAPVSAAGIDTTPEPAATSSTRWPGPIPQACTSWVPSGCSSSRATRG